MKPWIQNVSLADIKNGTHYDAGANSMLIQIVDPDIDFPKPKHQFKETYQYSFLDIEGGGMTNTGDGEMTDLSEFAITDDDARDLSLNLLHALINHMNVIVHCHAGVCRSGAVSEVGVMMGFRDTESFRAPNLLVKRKLLEQLGMAFVDTQHTINGNPIPEDWTNDNEKVFILAEARRKHREENE